MAKNVKYYKPGKNHGHRKYYWWRYILMFFLGQIALISMILVTLTGVVAGVDIGTIIGLFSNEPTTIVNEDYLDDSLLGFVLRFASGSTKVETLKDVSDIFPFTNQYFDQLEGLIEPYGVSLGDEIYTTEFAKLPEYLTGKIMEIKVADTLSSFNVNPNSIPVLPLLVYKTPVWKIELKDENEAPITAKTLEVGEEWPAEITYLPAKAFPRTVDITSSNTEVASVEEGTIKAVAEGTTNLTFTVNEEAAYVNAVPEDLTITVPVTVTPATKAHLLKSDKPEPTEGGEGGETGEGGQQQTSDHEHNFVYGECTVDGCDAVYQEARTLGEILGMTQNIPGLIGGLKIKDFGLPLPDMLNSLGDIQISKLLDGSGLKAIKLSLLLGENPDNAMLKELSKVSVGELMDGSFFNNATIGGLLGIDENTTGPLALIKDCHLTNIDEITSAIFSAQIKTVLGDPGDNKMLAALSDFYLSELPKASAEHTYSDQEAANAVLADLNEGTIVSIANTIYRVDVNNGVKEFAKCYTISSGLDNTTIGSLLGIDENTTGPLALIKDCHLTNTDEITQAINSAQISAVLGDPGDNKMLAAISDFYLSSLPTATADHTYGTQELADAALAELDKGTIVSINGVIYRVDVNNEVKEFVKCETISTGMNTLKIGDLFPDIAPDSKLYAFRNFTINELPTEFGNVLLRDMFGDPAPTGIMKILCDYTYKDGENNDCYLTITDLAGSKMNDAIATATIDDIMDLKNEPDGSLIKLFSGVKLNGSEISARINTFKIGQIMPGGTGLLAAIKDFYLAEYPAAKATYATIDQVPDDLSSFKVGDVIQVGSETNVEYYEIVENESKEKVISRCYTVQDGVDTLKLKDMMDLSGNTNPVVNILADKYLYGDDNDPNSVLGALNELKIGEAIGLEYKQDPGSDPATYSWYNSDNSLASALMQKVAGQPVMGGDLEGAVKTMKIGEVLGYQYNENDGCWYDGASKASSLMQVVAKETIGGDGLKNALNDLKIGEAMGLEYIIDEGSNPETGAWYDAEGNKASALMQVVADEKVMGGNLEGSVKGMKLGDLLGITDSETNVFLKAIKDCTLDTASIQGALNGLTFDDMFHETIYPNGATDPDGIWKLMLKEGGVVKSASDYKVMSDMSQLITNMKNNMSGTTLTDLAGMGLIDEGGLDTTLAVPNPFGGNPIPLNKDNPDKTLGSYTLGDLISLLTNLGNN